jgi:hypothetical protein
VNELRGDRYYSYSTGTVVQQASVLIRHGHRIIYVGMGLFEKFAGVAGRATETFHRDFVTLHGVVVNL